VKNVFLFEQVDREKKNAKSSFGMVEVRPRNCFLFLRANVRKKYQILSRTSSIAAKTFRKSR
jgi:hypothetical protein